jgi:hypothetical protein
MSGQTIDSSALLAAADVFDDIFRKHQEWFMRHERVSLAMMSERENIRARCEWAAKVLRDLAANAEAETSERSGDFGAKRR